MQPHIESDTQALFPKRNVGKDVARDLDNYRTANQKDELVPPDKKLVATEEALDDWLA